MRIKQANKVFKTVSGILQTLKCNFLSYSDLFRGIRQKVKPIVFYTAQSRGLDLGLVDASLEKTMSNLDIRKIF